MHRSAIENPSRSKRSITANYRPDFVASDSLFFVLLGFLFVFFLLVLFLRRFGRQALRLLIASALVQHQLGYGALLVLRKRDGRFLGAGEELRFGFRQ